MKRVREKRANGNRRPSPWLQLPQDMVSVILSLVPVSSASALLSLRRVSRQLRDAFDADDFLHWKRAVNLWCSLGTGALANTRPSPRRRG